MKPDKLILGDGAIFSTDSNETGLNNNIIVCGTSGCGKTMSVLEPRLLEIKNSSLIVTVTKRRIVNKYTPVLKERGYNILDLNFVNPELGNVTYDPLYYVKTYSDVRFLAEAIVKADPKKSTQNNADPYWDEAAISLLTAEISFVRETMVNPTFNDVLELHDRLQLKDAYSGLETTLDEEFQMLGELDPNSFAIQNWRSFKNLPIRTAGCVFGALNSTIDTIFSPELRECISHKQNIVFEDLANQKTVLFVSSSAVNPTLNCFINMFYAQAFKSLFEYAENLPNGELQIPVQVLCDDFATGSKILNFPEYISIFREKRISVTLLIQSESQLDSMYGSDDAITIINNCDTYLYMGSMDLKTAHNVSERVNLPLDEVLYMPLGQEFIFRRGQHPIITNRYNVLADKEYRKITAAFEKELALRY